MRPSGRLLAVTAAVLLFAGLGAGPAVAAPQDRVSGSGTVGFLVPAQVAINAHGSPTDADGTTSFAQLGTGFSVKGTVTCLNVVGNTATASGPLKNIDPETSPYRFMWVQVIDNGTAGSGTPDRVALVLSFDDPGCLETLTGSSPVQQGNFTVTDR